MLITVLLTLVPLTAVRAGDGGQLKLEWYLETPANENHMFRGIAVSKSGQDAYIADMYTDVVYIYANNGSNALKGSFSDPSWSQSYVGPYGVGIAGDGQVYVAIWADDTYDPNGDGNPDHALWRCTPYGRNLRRVCYLPDAPRGVKVVGGGSNTVVYVSGTLGNVIRCTPLNANTFRAELLFNTGVTLNQQEVAPDRTETSLYVSSWTPDYGWTPYESAVTKWNHLGVRDETFSVSYLGSGNVPGVILNNTGDALYVFNISFRGAGLGAFIRRVDVNTGGEESLVMVGPRGQYGGGGINVDRSGAIFFSRTLEFRDGYLISAWGKVTNQDFGKLGDNNTGGYSSAPQDFLLAQNYPNPFNPSTTIEFALPHAGFVTLRVYNALGEEVAALVAGDHAPGTFKATWDASGQASGVYFYRLTAGEYVQTKKMVLMK